MTDRDFAWLLGEREPAHALRVAEGGVAPGEVIRLVRRVTGEVSRGTTRELSWMVADGDEVVGMISCTKPAGERRYEIGYGIAPSRAGRGHMTAAVSALIGVACQQGLFGLTAATGVDNRGSQRVLEKNDFVRTGRRSDPEDGDMITWAHDLGTGQRTRLGTGR